MGITKVAGYGRMSTSEQTESPKVQEEKIRRWFDYQVTTDKWPDGAEFVGTFVDEAVSSRTNMLDRKYGQHLLTVLDHGDLVVVSKLDRAFRSAADTEVTMNTLTAAGIGIAFLDMNIDSSTALGQFMLGIATVMARFERDQTQERTIEALRSKQKRGEAVGSAVAGYMRDKKNKKNKKLLPDIEQRKLGYAAAELIRKGDSRTMVGTLLRPFVKQHEIKCGVGDRTLVNTASASCLDFPICGARKSSEILGMNTMTFEFVKRTDHDALKDKLYGELREQGWDISPSAKPR
jgi:putative DNA-invertase from lambdoid prophage Rac